MFGKKVYLLTKELGKLSKKISLVNYYSLSSSSSSSYNGTNKISSLSFSGAGFLGCYHLGAVECLMKHGLLWDPLSSDEKLPILTGVSAGALIIAGITVGVKPEDGMSVVLDIARNTREKTGILNTFQPGYVHIYTSTLRQRKTYTHC